ARSIIQWSRTASSSARSPPTWARCWAMHTRSHMVRTRARPSTRTSSTDRAPRLVLTLEQRLQLGLVLVLAQNPTRVQHAQQRPQLELWAGLVFEPMARLRLGPGRGRPGGRRSTVVDLGHRGRCRPPPDPTDHL